MSRGSLGTVNPNTWASFPSQSTTSVESLWWQVINARLVGILITNNSGKHNQGHRVVRQGRMELGSAFPLGDTIYLDAMMVRGNQQLV